jgi:cyclophilin family peptidyl-prolyl cis-trans isomerase
MNQTTWVVIGGFAIILVAAGLYQMSAPTIIENPPPRVGESNTTESTLPVGTSGTDQKPSGEQITTDMSKASEAILKTNMGDITIKLYAESAPNTVENFTKLANEKFYDGVKFHRVIEGFMNQAGDPLSKDDSKKSMWGTGGPGYKFADEIDPSSPVYQKGYEFGVVAMANSGPDTNGSQFFIMAKDYPLPPKYTIFGEVTSGLDVVTKINETPTDSNDRPLSPVILETLLVR